MNKPTKKTLDLDPATVKEVADAFSFSKDYVRKCLRGDRKGIMPDEVLKMYNRITALKSKATQQVINDTIPNK